MTDKQKALRIYPNVICKKINYNFVYWHLIDKDTGNSYGYLAFNPKRAWKYLWNDISNQMMEALES